MGFWGKVVHSYDYTECKGHVCQDKVSMLEGEIPHAPGTVMKECLLSKLQNESWKVHSTNLWVTKMDMKASDAHAVVIPTTSMLFNDLGEGCSDSLRSQGFQCCFCI